MFSIGHLVSCVVMQVDDDKKEKAKRKIWLSLRLSLVQKGFTLEAIQEGMVSFLKFLKRQVKGVDFEYSSMDHLNLNHEQNKSTGLAFFLLTWTFFSSANMSTCMPSNFRRINGSNIS